MDSKAVSGSDLQIGSDKIKLELERLANLVMSFNVTGLFADEDNNGGENEGTNSQQSSCTIGAVYSVPP